MARRITPLLVARVRQMASAGRTTREIMRCVGLSETSVNKIRQGRYPLRPPREDEDDRVAVWCPRCRCHVYPPCVVCRLRASAQRPVRCTRTGGQGVAPAMLGRPARSSTTAAALPAELAARLQMSVAELGLPLRVVNFLEARQILLVGDLLQCTAEELLAQPNVARKTLELIYAALERIGFRRRSPQGAGTTGASCARQSGDCAPATRAGALDAGPRATSATGGVVAPR
jgi:hypothetical protein